MMFREPGMFRGCGMMPGGLVGLLILGMIIYLLIKYFKDDKSSSNKFNRTTNALNLLDERYAKGEIDEDEYIKRKRVLKD